MIVSEVMTTRLITITPGDTLSHAANLLRQYQFHHLPVVRSTFGVSDTGSGQQPVLEGLLTSQDIDVAAAVGTWSSSELLHRPWQERRVVEVMHRAVMRVNSTTSVAAAPRLLVARGLNCLPVAASERPEPVKDSTAAGALVSRV